MTLLEKMPSSTDFESFVKDKSVQILVPAIMGFSSLDTCTNINGLPPEKVKKLSIRVNREERATFIKGANICAFPAKYINSDTVRLSLEQQKMMIKCINEFIDSKIDKSSYFYLFLCTGSINNSLKQCIERACEKYKDITIYYYI